MRVMSWSRANLLIGYVQSRDVNIDQSQLANRNTCGAGLNKKNDKQLQEILPQNRKHIMRENMNTVQHVHGNLGD